MRKWSLQTYLNIFMILAMLYIYILVESYDYNVNIIDLEELLEEVDKDFNDYKVIIVKQSYPHKAIESDFLSDNMNISGESQRGLRFLIKILRYFP